MELKIVFLSFASLLTYLHILPDLIPFEMAEGIVGKIKGLDIVVSNTFLPIRVFTRCV